MDQETLVMTAQEALQSHERTRDYVASVKKLWEQIASEQRDLIKGEGYRHFGYETWAKYWNGEFAENSGWSSQTISNWIAAKNVKDATPFTGAGKYVPESPENWKDLAGLEAEERVEFLDRYPTELKDVVGPGPHPFRRAVKAFKAEKNGTPMQGALESLAEKAARGELPASPPYQKIHRKLYELEQSIGVHEAGDVAEGAIEQENDGSLKLVFRQIEKVRGFLNDYEEALSGSGKVVELRVKEGGRG